MRINGQISCKLLFFLISSSHFFVKIFRDAVYLRFARYFFKLNDLFSLNIRGLLLNTKNTVQCLSLSAAPGSGKPLSGARLASGAYSGPNHCCGVWSVLSIADATSVVFL